MNESAYLEELRQRLSFRGASRKQVKDIVAEVRSHLADSGEDPVDAFGKPDEYAESVLRGYRWPTARVLAMLLLTVPGGSIVVRSVNAWRNGEGVVPVQTDEFVFWLVLSLVISLGLMPGVHRRFAGTSSRTLTMFLVAGLAAGGAGYLGSSLFGERAMVSFTPWLAFSVGFGLLGVAALVAVAWRFLRRSDR
jgi:HAAS domain-containing protein